MTYWCGIDPGKKGSICLLDEYANIEFVDINTSGGALLEGFADYTPRIMLERVTPMQKGGLVSAWRFGHSVGRIEGILECTELGYDTVPPKTWQKECGVIIPPKTPPAQRKRITEAVVNRLYPKAEIYGPKGGLLDGRADALLIAHYCMLRYK
jgi:hypothetical protein